MPAGSVYSRTRSLNYVTKTPYLVSPGLNLLEYAVQSVCAHDDENAVISDRAKVN